MATLSSDALSSQGYRYQATSSLTYIHDGLGQHSLSCAPQMGREKIFIFWEKKSEECHNQRLVWHGWAPPKWTSQLSRLFVNVTCPQCIKSPAGESMVGFSPFFAGTVAQLGYWSPWRPSTPAGGAVSVRVGVPATATDKSLTLSGIPANAITTYIITLRVVTSLCTNEK